MDELKKEEDSCVQVALKLRPLIDIELSERCQPCVYVTPGQPQVSIGRDKSRHTFTYDNVFGEGGAPPEQLFPACVENLVEGLFRGYNATVFAYGQTGSGKTYTMGSAFSPGGTSTGVIPRVMETIFHKIGTTRDVDFTVRVSFVEIHKEEIKDLLIMQHRGSRTAVAIREVAGGVCLAGAVEKEVTCKEEMMTVLEQGSLCRATASTGMNNRSSRSHAIYTITVEQRRRVCETPRGTPVPGVDQSDDDEDGGVEPMEDFLCAKMHLVDLAGSERAKRTKAEGTRLQEGIHINKGLLALANVIQALVDKHSHIPYRDSKLTRLLQDSLGGNSRTLMIACVSPADSNFEETLNTLRYADRARHIHNKPVVNRDPVAAQLTALRQQVAMLRAENLELKRQNTRMMSVDGSVHLSASFSNLDRGLSASATESQLVTMLTEMEDLQVEVQQLRRKSAQLTDELAASASIKKELAAVERERDSYKALYQQLVQHAGSDGKVVLTEEIFSEASSQLLGEYKAQNHELQHHNQELQTVIARLQQDLQGLIRRAHGPGQETPLASAPSVSSPVVFSPDVADGDDPVLDEHVAQQQKVVDDMFQQMETLQGMIDRKDAQVQQLQKAQNAPAFKAKYDHLVAELQHDLEAAEREKTKLMQELHKLKSMQDDAKKKLAAEYKERIEAKELKIRELRKKEEEYREMQRLQRRSEQACSKLAEDIQRLKAQKVQMQKAASAAQQQIVALKQQQSREVLQLKKQSRRDAAKLQQYEAMHAKQQAVLKRKTQEAEAARKRLKEITELQRCNSRFADRESRSAPSSDDQADVQPNSGAPLLRNEKACREWLEQELDVCNQVCELQTVLDGELAIRSEHARQLREVEKKLTLVNGLLTPSPSSNEAALRSSIRESQPQLMGRKQDLEGQISERTERIKELEARITRARMDEENKAANDARRWTGVRTIVEARVLLRALFKCASEFKVGLRELQKESASLQEQYELAKLEREASRQEVHQAKMRVAKLEAEALRSSTASLQTAAVQVAHQVSGTEDAEVDELLRQVQVVAQTPPPEPRRRPRVEEQQPQTQGRANSRQPQWTSTTTASTPIAEDWAAASDDSDQDGDDDRDGDWRPDVATPYGGRSGRHQQVRQHRPQARRQAWGPTAADDTGPSTSGAATAATAREGGVRAERPRSTPIWQDEQVVLAYINDERERKGLLGYDRLTVKTLKEELMGREVDGEPWKPKNKNKEHMIRDYMAVIRASTTPSPSPRGPASRPSPQHRPSPQRPQTALLTAPTTPKASTSNRISDPGDVATPVTTPMFGSALAGMHARRAAAQHPHNAAMHNFKAALLSTPSPSPSRPQSATRLQTPGSSARVPVARWQVRQEQFKNLEAVKLTPQAYLAKKEGDDADRRSEHWRLRKSQVLGTTFTAGRVPVVSAMDAAPKSRPSSSSQVQPWKN